MISELNNEELKAKMEELEIELPRFNRKKAIELIIEKQGGDQNEKALEGNEDAQEPELEKVLDKPEPAPAKKVFQGIKEERVAVGSKAQKMKEKLSKQPKKSIFIPFEQGEKPGVTLSVTLNGYRLNIRKGVYVEVPSQVADVVMDSLNQTAKAMVENVKLLDGDSPAELNR